MLQRDVPAAADSLSGQDRGADLRVRHVRQRSFCDAGEFLDRLDPFLATLPPEFRYAVEIRNPEFLEKDYFACLRDARRRARVQRVVEDAGIAGQIAIPDSVTADFMVCRALLRRGRVMKKP